LDPGINNIRALCVFGLDCPAVAIRACTLLFIPYLM
jgi:hypothetical protein